jgi:hypothetical protein
MRTLALGKVGLALATLVAVVAALAVVGVASVGAQQDTTYTVTIENLTSGQPFTPPVLAAHTNQIDLFEVGTAASAELQQLAENGNADPLVTLLGGSSAVLDTVTGTAPIMPGQSATLTVTAPAGSLFSLAFMLICTNDGFSGVDSLALPASGSQTVNQNAYDAGTENNTEDFIDMVPPCQELIGVSSSDAGTGATNPVLAEGGVVAAHAGIQGGTDLTIADHGWTDPVAKITVSAGSATLPDSGGTPPGGDSGSLWALYLAIGGAVVLVAGGAFLVVSRRTVR